ncbi:MAG: hypothetical protein EXS37_00880 [Opitutus sp.]|nr:hypothetical protein [Opitutus sp.]
MIRSLGAYYEFGLRDSAKATEQFEKLVRLQPNDGEAYHWLAIIQFGRGHFAEGLATRRMSTTLDPANARNVAEYVKVLIWVRRYDDAIAESRRMMALRPSRSGDKHMLAVLQWRATGSRRELEALLARQMASEPDSPETMDIRKRMSLALGDYPEFFRLDRLHPDIRTGEDFSPAWDPVDGGAIQAALAYLNQGDRDGARARLGKIPSTFRAQLELQPENTAFLRRCAKVEAILGNKEEALRLIEEAAKRTPEATSKFVGTNVSIYRTEVLAILGEKDRALAELARLLRVPSDLNVHVMRNAPVYFQLRGDPRFEALLNDPKNNAPLF